MIRWIFLILGIVVISASIPLLLSMQSPSVDSGNGVAFPTGLVGPAGPVGHVYLAQDKTYHFGRQTTHWKGEQKFTIKNVGEAPLKLQPGSKTCMCTVANFENGEKEVSIPPGESTVVTVTFNTKGKAGKFEQRTSIMTSDPDQPEVFFTILGDVSQAIVTMPDPAAFDVGTIPNDKPFDARLAISSFDKPDLQIVETVISNPEQVAVTFKPLGDEEKRFLKYENGYRFDIQVLPLPQLGSFSETVTIKTDHPGQAELVVTVRGKRTGAITVFPEIVRSQTTSSRGANLSAVITVRNHKETVFEVADKPADVVVSVQKAEDTTTESKVDRYRLQIQIPAGTPAKLIEGNVVLKTNHPTVQTLRIPLSVTIDADE